MPSGFLLPGSGGILPPTGREALPLGTVVGPTDPKLYFYKKEFDALWPSVSLS